LINLFKASGVKWLHFTVFTTIEKGGLHQYGIERFGRLGKSVELKGLNWYSSANKRYFYAKKKQIFVILIIPHKKKLLKNDCHYVTCTLHVH